MKAFLTRQSSSFTYLNVTQFLGALNDNIFKFLIIFFCIGIQGPESSSVILALAGAVFVIPFLLFSSTSGTLADRFSKRDIIVSCKMFELVIMILGVLSFTFKTQVGAYMVLFLMATQSAIFGPSKYGIIPEIVRSEKISQANGMLTSFTFLAIIIGTFLASFLTDITGRNFIMTSMFCTSISAVGVFTSYYIESTPPSGSVKKISPFFLREIYYTLKLIKPIPSLLTAAFGSAYFMFAGAYIQLNIIPFAIDILNLTDVQGGYLFLLAAVGIGSGAMAAGKLSGNHVELGFVSLSGMGMSMGCFLLDYWSHNIYIVLPMILILGFLGGMFLVPLDAYIQLSAPDTSRGQVVATTNFIGFMGVLLASAVLYLISDILGIPPDKGFTFLGYTTLLMTLFIGYSTYDYLTRFLGMVVSKVCFGLAVYGEDDIPNGKPCVYVCKHTCWTDTILLMGSQGRRMRFFKEKPLEGPGYLKHLYRLFRVVFVPSIELLDTNEKKKQKIFKCLKKGISVCIFVPNNVTKDEFSEITLSVQKILEETEHPTIVASIARGTSEPNDSLLTRFVKMLHVPAFVSFHAVKTP